MLRSSGRSSHAASCGVWALTGRLLRRLNDVFGYGNLAGLLDLVIVQSLTFLGMSLLGFVVLSLSGAPFNEETKRVACLLLPLAAAPFPGILLNNLHRFKMAMDHLLLTGDILIAQPHLSVPAAWRLGSGLMARIKQAVGYNRRPACRYMRNEYPFFLQKVTERVRSCSIPAGSEALI